MDSVVHFEIPADDMKRAQKFYGAVFGWKTNEIPEMGYALIQTAPTDEKNMVKEPGAINGGMTRRGEPVKYPVITINVSDIEVALKKIMEAGGEVVMGKTGVGDIGFSAYFRDSEGNVLGLWQNK